jgi:serine/threonine protein kinase
MKTKTKKRTLGSGLSAKCVVGPALKCKTQNKINLRKSVSKIVQEPDSDILKEILERETFTSALIKSHPNKNLVERFVTIDIVCPLDFSINKNKEKFINENCEIDNKYNYFLLNMYNGACLTSGKRKGKICGNLSNIETCKFLTQTSDHFKKTIRYLLEAIDFLHSLKLSHCDIKPLNILCDEKGKVRIIDFGSSLFLENMDKGKNQYTRICENLSKILTEKTRSLSNNKDKTAFYNKVAAITPLFTPLEIAITRSFLKNPNILFSEMYIELILNYGKNDSKELQRLVKYYMKNSKKIIGDLFCNKKRYIYGWDVYSLGKTIKEIYKIGKNTDKLPSNLNDLVNKMTNEDYRKRINLKQALSHSYFN